MEELLGKVVYGNTVLNWGIFLLLMIGSIIGSKILYLFIGNYFKKYAEKTKTNLDYILIDMIEEPLVIVLSLYGIKYSLNYLVIPAGVSTNIYSSIGVLVTCIVGWGVYRTFNALVNEYLEPIAKSTESSFDDQILSILKKGLNLVVISLTILIAISNAGYNIGALLTGLGIGGLAFALAAQDTVGNLFGGITIIADKPFKINDRVEVHGHDGIILDIGLRSTRLRTVAEHRIVTIPNSMFTNDAIKNISSEPTRMIELDLGLTYDTTPEKMILAKKILAEIVANNDKLENDFIASFTAFNDFSLNLKFRYFINTEYDYYIVQDEINLEILTKFNDNNLDFAFPTQTIQAEVKQVNN